MTTLTAAELVEKYVLKLAERNGIKGFTINCSKKIVTNKTLEMLKSNKPAIMEYLEAKKAEQEAVKRAEAEKEQQYIAGIKNGSIKIEVYYRDGEYYSGYATGSKEAELLTELKLAKYISGWGTTVTREVVEALGKEFTYQQAVEYAKPKLDAIEAKKAVKAAAIAAKFAEAKETGKPVLLSQWSADCNDPHEDCSVDIVCEYAMPNGSTKIERNHTW